MKTSKYGICARISALLLCLCCVCACNQTDTQTKTGADGGSVYPIGEGSGGDGGSGMYKNYFEKLKLPEAVTTEDRLDYVYRVTAPDVPREGFGFSAEWHLSWDGEHFLATAGAYDEYGFYADTAPIVYKLSPENPTLTECTDAVTLPPADAVRQSFVLSDGSLLYTTVETAEDGGSALYLHVTDAEDAQTPLFSLDLSYEFGVDFTAVMHGQGIFSILDAIRTTTAEGERYVLLTTEGYAALDAGGAVLWSSYKGKYPRALMETPVGVLYLYGDYDDMHFCPIDLATGALGTDILLPDGFALGGLDDAFYMGDGFDLYMKNSEALWGMTFTVDKDGRTACELERVVDFGMSALVSSEIVDVAIADRDNLAVLCRDSVTGSPVCTLLLLRHIPREAVEARETVTLAALGGIDRRMARAVSDFNRESETHRIVLKDYSGYGDGRNKTFFDFDIAAGRIPDMVVFGDTDGMREIYENIGLFCDLTPLIDADSAFSADLLGYTKTPYLREDGVQYVFPLSPTCGVLWGDGTVLDGPVSTEEAVSRGLSRGLLNGLFLRYTDPIAHTCSFDDPGFIAGLELLLADADMPGAEHPLIRDTAPEAGLYGWVTHKLLYGDTPIPVGIPVDGERLVVHDSYAASYFGITVTSAHADTCISFLRELIAAQSVRETTYFTRSQVYAAVEQYADIRLFVTSDGIRELRAAALSEPEYSVMMGINPAYYDGIVGDGYQITDADADALIAFLDDIDGIIPMPGDSVLYDIYQGEYFQANGRTAKDIASAMQSRASIYLAEAYG